MQTVIETEAEVIEDERLKPEDIPAEDIPAYTVAGAIAWMQRPENERTIRQWSDSVREKWNGMVAGIDREVSKVGRLMIDMAEDDNVLEDVKTQFLKSLIGDD